MINTILISDFNIEPLARYLENDTSLPSIKSTIAPFGQVMQTLIDDSLDCWKKSYDMALIWTRPEGVIDSFSKAMNFQQVSLDDIFAEVDEFAKATARLEHKVKTVIVPTWVMPFYRHGYGMLNMKKGLGLKNTLMRMNLRLADNIENVSNVFVLDAERWFQGVEADIFNPKLWYMGKIPYGNTVFKKSTLDIKSALQGIAGNAKKIIIVDLDDILWGGIVGDVGWKNLRLGGHDPIGEAFVDFQKALKTYKNRGILLGIASKNEESVALEAISSHPEMVLELKDFAGWRINWEDKALNIIELMKELNLGVQSAVFIDDNAVERARVGESLPEVLVPEWPTNKMFYKKALLSLTCFDTTAISEEDSKRAEQYLAEKKRKSLKSTLVSLDEWLKTLMMKVQVEELTTANIQRTIQLLNKTNQMNLSTRRMTEGEFLKWAHKKKHKVWTFRVSDKFGDSGLTGIASLDNDGAEGTIVDFILSCRVMGRKVEETMLHVIVEYAQSLGLKTLIAKYLPTPKNMPCYKFWRDSGFTHNEKDDTFTWKLNTGYSKPECIELIEEDNV